MRSKISGKKCIKILCKEFGFVFARQKGSHVVLKKSNYGTVVPLHKEIKLGTLKNILRLARVSEEDFWRKK